MVLKVLLVAAPIVANGLQLAQHHSGHSRDFQEADLVQRAAAELEPVILQEPEDGSAKCGSGQVPVPSKQACEEIRTQYVNAGRYMQDNKVAVQDTGAAPHGCYYHHFGSSIRKMYWNDNTEDKNWRYRFRICLPAYEREVTYSDNLMADLYPEPVTGTLATCRARCSANPECVAFVRWTKDPDDNLSCYLKKGALSLKKSDPWTTYVKTV